MKILFVGESWFGSTSRSMRDALARRDDVEMDELSEEACFPPPSRVPWLRAASRLTTPAYHKAFNAEVLARVRDLRPDVVMTCKGNPIRAELVRAIQALGAKTVNIYPDCSPHAHGKAHRDAVGCYDLVASTKAYHPALWHELYGYDNRCVFIPKGYEPALHLVPTPPAEQPFDVLMVATYRPEYGKLMLDFARALDDPRVSVAIGGNGWGAVRANLPSHWQFPGPAQGRRYVSLLRQGKVCIAPVTRDVVIDGRRQPGDVDSVRTYELAAAYCFFIHRRTDYVKTVYDEATEVPMFDDGAELAKHVQHFLARPEMRTAMATAAHRRAVPSCSIDERAGAVIAAIERYT